MSVVDKFNALHGAVVSRKDIQRLVSLAKKENATDIIYRLSRILNDNPNFDVFDVEIKKYTQGQGLNGSYHTGVYKEALDECGRLRKGFKFENGSVVKIVSKKTPVRTPIKITPEARKTTHKKVYGRKPKKITKPIKKQDDKHLTNSKSKAPEPPKSYAKKPKSISINTSVKGVLTLDEYSDIKPLQASILYSLFKDVEDLDEAIEIKSKYNAGILKSIKRDYGWLFSYDDAQEDWHPEFTINYKGEKLIEAIKNRQESLKKQKHNYSMFDGLNGAELIKPVVKPPSKKIALNSPAVVEKTQPIPKQAPNKPKDSLVVSSEELMNMEFETIKMEGPFAKFMQEPAKNMKLAIWGKPKNGKTSGAAQLANYLTKFGVVLYNFADQGFNKSTQDIWRNSGMEANPDAFPGNAKTLDDLEKLCATGNYDFVFIDMINDYIDKEGIKPYEFKERFMEQFPNISFILIMEVTKSGNFRGDQKWTHIVDAICTVDNYLMENRGRYGSGHYVVWEKGFKEHNPKKYAELIEEEKAQNPAPETMEAANETPLLFTVK